MRVRVQKSAGGLVIVNAATGEALEHVQAAQINLRKDGTSMLYLSIEDFDVDLDFPDAVEVEQSATSA